MRSDVAKSLVLLPLLSLLSCTFISDSFDALGSDSAKSDPALSVVKSVSPQAPFELKIVAEENVGDRFGVVAAVTPQTDVTGSDAVLILSGLAGGESIVEDSRVIAESTHPDTSGSLKVGEPIKLALSIASAEVSDYQVELLWGEEARSYLTARKQKEYDASPVIARNIEVETQFEQCLFPPCPRLFTIYGDLLNNGSSVISQVTLGVGLRWVPNEGSARQPESEELVTVERTLEPSQSRPFKLVIDRKIPEKPDGHYEPSLRIVSYG